MPRTIRAAALMVVLGEARTLPEFQVLAQSVGMADQYHELRAVFGQIANQNSATQRWGPAEVAVSELLRVIDQRRRSARLWLIHGGASEDWTMIRSFIERDLGHPCTEFCDPHAQRIEVSSRVREMLERSELAVAVMSGEERLPDGRVLPRANVVHEIGLSQGLYGVERVIILRESGVECFSNMSGIVYIEFSRGSPGAAFNELRHQVDLRL
ncbi:MAG: nucleotide-binding protein [Planctomycetes bacterium]|nr:nucleotide-binding protein [Planctomycetota bacterium]